MNCSCQTCIAWLFRVNADNQEVYYLPQNIYILSILLTIYEKDKHKYQEQQYSCSCTLQTIMVTICLTLCTRINTRLTNNKFNKQYNYNDASLISVITTTPYVIERSCICIRA
ncbi:unnamed protein product [Paramecium sonneborni]|uniref:Uncharacterized protein n=1 Tax=Paramecium sonneborni TaxID=65129 RepID=A0A8S1NF19_9CILI|nr:unnamed protein product [Paramecium sonneborni]CAD8087699.1 unnamed protein product [Paramecium sonneborni]